MDQDQQVVVKDDALPDQPPVVADPPTEDPLIQMRIDKAKSDARAEAYKELALQGRPTQSFNPGPIIPNDPTDLLTPDQKSELQALYITDPMKAAKWYGDLRAQVERSRIEREAEPLVATSAAGIVEMYINRRARSSKIAAQTEPLFRQKLVGQDIRPLVRMNEAQRETELSLRWDASEAEVMRNQPPPRPDPKLTSNPNVTQPGSLKKSKIEDDEWITAMAKEYKMTPEQIAYIEEDM